MRPHLLLIVSVVGLLANGPTALADEKELAKRYTELAKKHTDALTEFVAALYRARTREQRREANAISPSTSEYAKQFLEIAGTPPVSEAGLSALSWILTYTPGSPEAEEAYALLIRDHLDNPKLANVLGFIGEWPTAAGEKLLRAATEKSAVPAVRARACYTLATLLVARSKREGSNATESADSAPTQPPHVEAETLFKKLGTDFGDLKASNSRSYGSLARAALADLASNHGDAKTKQGIKVGPEVGLQAPEIDGRDAKGKPVRLSGLQGSVVVVNFWADWCPYCHDIYPFGRSLKYRFGDKPVVLLGINGDFSRDQLRQLMADEQMTWPNIWDGRGGPISSRYNVERWPATFVIDHNGVIRYRASGIVDEQSLTAAVRALLAEQPLAPRVEGKKPAGPQKKANGAKKKASR